MKHKKKKKKGIKDYLRLLLLTICLCVFVYSGYQLLSIFLEYENINSSYAGLLDEYVVEEDGYHIINWEELLARNPDVIGWIQIPDTNIDYPVLQGETNDTYLRHDIDGKYLIAGCIFADAGHGAPLEEPNTIIYGHNMKNDSMFSDLLEYTDDPKFVESHPTVYMYLPDGTVSKYKIVSAHEVDAREDVYTLNLPNLDDYYQHVLEGNVLNVPFEQDNSPMITMSTCKTYDVEAMSRVAVHAVLEQKGINPKEEKMQ
ncbi:MAG: class B sortase [Coprobacillaceae bacterium]